MLALLLVANLFAFHADSTSAPLTLEHVYFTCDLGLPVEHCEPIKMAKHEQMIGFDAGDPPQRPFPLALALLPAAGQLWDADSTRRIRERGEHAGFGWVELNPVVALAIGLGVKGRPAVFLKALGGLVYGLTVRALSRFKPRLARVLLAIGTAAGAGPALHNEWSLKHPTEVSP